MLECYQDDACAGGTNASSYCPSGYKSPCESIKDIKWVQLPPLPCCNGKYCIGHQTNKNYVCGAVNTLEDCVVRCIPWRALLLNLVIMPVTLRKTPGYTPSILVYPTAPTRETLIDHRLEQCFFFFAHQQYRTFITCRPPDIVFILMLQSDPKQTYMTRMFPRVVPFMHFMRFMQAVPCVERASP